MNVEIEVNGLSRVDFASPTGWIRNPQVELCGVDDDDLCIENVKKWFDGISAVPFENLAINDCFVDGANEDLKNAVEQYCERKEEVHCTGTIYVKIRPVPKSSRDATPEEIETFVKGLNLK